MSTLKKMSLKKIFGEIAKKLKKAGFGNAEKRELAYVKLMQRKDSKFRIDIDIMNIDPEVYEKAKAGLQKLAEEKGLKFSFKYLARNMKTEFDYIYSVKEKRLSEERTINLFDLEDI